MNATYSTAYTVRNALGETISRHRTENAAIRAAVRECKTLGLVDDGACCSDDGWPSIASDDGRRVDYPAPPA